MIIDEFLYRIRQQMAFEPTREQAQAMMKQMKNHKAKDYDSLWDEEGGEYDPEAAAENAEATGELPEIPETGTEAGTEASSDEAGL